MKPMRQFSEEGGREIEIEEENDKREENKTVGGDTNVQGRVRHMEG